MKGSVPPKRTPPRRRRKAADDAIPTRRRLLEAAGQVFAEKGYDATTGKEICERAEVNSAAVNYYFGGVEGLYAAVLDEARERFVATPAVLGALQGKTDAHAKLGAILELLVRAASQREASSWAIRVLGREVVSPSPLAESLWENIQMRLGLLKGVVSELMDLPPDHPAVARACVSVIGPCLMLLVYDRRNLDRLLPQLDLSAENVHAIVDQWRRFLLAGLAAVAEEAKKNG